MERPGPASRLLLLLLCCSSVQTRFRHPLPVLWMMPAGGGEKENLSVAPAVQLALKDLQEQPPPLGNYEVQLQLLETQCEVSSALRGLFDAMWAGPKYSLVLGEACPSLTPLIARALPAFNLVQVAFSAPPPALSNRKWYGNLFSTVPSERAVHQAAVKLLQRHKWTRVGLVWQEDPQLAEVRSDLTRQLLRAGVQVVSGGSLAEEACRSLRRLKESDVRIFIGLFDDESAAEVFCCASRLRLLGSSYQWILTAGGAVGSRPGRRRVPGCSSADLLAATDSSIRLQITPVGGSKEPGVSGRSPLDLLLQLTPEGSEASPLLAYAYDAAWVAAGALSRVMEAARRREKYGNQRNSTLSQEELEQTLLEVLRRTHLEGVTGTLFFRNGERVASVQLVQRQGSQGVLVGEFSSSSQELQLNQHLQFKGGGPPRDRLQVHLLQRRVGLLLLCIMWAAAVVMVLLTLWALVLTVVRCRARGPLGRDGPLDQLPLLLGLLLSSTSILLSGLDRVSPSDQLLEVLCSVQLWTFSVGEMLTFSVLLAETWRCYPVCGGISQQRPAGWVVLSLFLLEMLVLSCWQTLDPLKWVETKLPAERDPAYPDVEIRPFFRSCSGSSLDAWLTAVYAYKAALLGVGCFMTWDLKAQQQDQARRLSLSVSSMTALGVLGASGSLLASDDPPLHFGLTGTLVLVCNLLVLGWMLGEKRQSSGSEVGELRSFLSEEASEEQLSSLNLHLRRQVAQLDVEIQSVTMKLSQAWEILHHAHISPLTHVAQVFAEDEDEDREGAEDINSPERVGRRLSVQLPILHHAYLPAITASRSSLLDA